MRSYLLHDVLTYLLTPMHTSAESMMAYRHITLVFRYWRAVSVLDTMDHRVGSSSMRPVSQLLSGLPDFMIPTNLQLSDRTLDFRIVFREQ